jgi:hypothetical protein
MTPITAREEIVPGGIATRVASGATADPPLGWADRHTEPAGTSWSFDGPAVRAPGFQVCDGIGSLRGGDAFGPSSTDQFAQYSNFAGYFDIAAPTGARRLL